MVASCIFPVEEGALRLFGVLIVRVFLDGPVELFVLLVYYLEHSALTPRAW